MLIVACAIASIAALSFTSTNILTVTDATEITDVSPGTVLVWIYPTSVTTIGRSLFKSAGSGFFAISVRASNDGDFQLALLRATSNLIVNSAASTLTANTWQMIGATWDATLTDADQELWLGTQTSAMAEVTYGSTQSVGSGTINTTAGGDLRIGNNNATSNPFPGSIAFVGMWNRRLSQGEMEAQRLRPHVTSGCVLFTWLGLAGTGNQLDLSGNDNHATVSGASQADGPPVVLLPWSGTRKITE